MSLTSYLLPEPGACYQALCARDARFDGRFFVAVTSTGIYCRPICRVRTPKETNCRFFPHAAAAEEAGFRPCLRCRPELAPGARFWSTEDASAILATHAVQLLQNPTHTVAANDAIAQVCERLGISDRHLRRVFETELGVSPAQYLLTQRLLNAKQLIADTHLKLSEVATASGFGSVRRFNDAFVQRYGMRPSDMRKQPAFASAEIRESHTKLKWRPPVAVDQLMTFLQQRAIAGVEHIERNASGWTIWRTIGLNAATGRDIGWLRVDARHESHEIQLTLSESLQPHLPELTWRVRHWLDLDADPMAIGEVMANDFQPAADGLRLPGAIDGFELGVRAILGQQVSVKAARTMAGRVVRTLGEQIASPHPEVNTAFPTPQSIKDADAELLGSLGVTRQRQAALKALATAVCDGAIDLSPTADVQDTQKALVQLPGIGPWTAAYIAMRALHWPDIWLSGDLVLKQALEQAGVDPDENTRRHGEIWAPWRSYAVIAIWAGLLRNQQGTKP